MRTCLAYSLLVLAVLVASTPSASIGAEPPTERDLVSRYKAAVAAATASYKCVQASGVLRDEIVAGKRKLLAETNLVFYARNGNLKVIRRTRVDNLGIGDEPGETVLGRNDRTYFRLDQKRKDAPHVIRYLGNDGAMVENDINRYGAAFAAAAYSLCALDVHEMVNSRNFVVTNASQEAAGRELVKITFRYKPSGNPNSFEGWYTVSPRDGWGVVDYRVDVWTGKQKGVMSGSVSYAGMHGKVPVPDRVETASVFGDYKETHILTFDKFSFEPPPVGEFSLGNAEEDILIP